MPFPEYSTGQLCLSVPDTERQGKKGLTLVTGVAHCLSGTHRMGALVGPKGENWHWLRGWAALSPRAAHGAGMQQRKYAGVPVLYTDTGHVLRHTVET